MSTEINVYVVIGILALHLFADFVMQNDKQAKGKSKNMNDLLSHTFMYSTWFFVFSLFYSAVTKNNHIIYLFPIITFVCHHSGLPYKSVK